MRIIILIMTLVLFVAPGSHATFVPDPSLPVLTAKKPAAKVPLIQRIKVKVAQLLVNHAAHRLLKKQRSKNEDKETGYFLGPLSLLLAIGAFAMLFTESLPLVLAMAFLSILAAILTLVRFNVKFTGKKLSKKAKSARTFAIISLILLILAGTFAAFVLIMFNF